MAKLFAHHLAEAEKQYYSRPQFLYRLNRLNLVKIRWRFNTYLRRPFAIAPYYQFSGWFFKGSMTYLFYYIFFKRQPVTKHWNREGYHYETHHKAPAPMQ